MRETILKNLACWHAVHPWRMLLVCGLLTVFFGAFAGRLSVTMQTSDLLPEKNEKVIQFNKVLDEFRTATSLVVVVQGEEARIKKYADTVAPRLLGLTDSSRNDYLRAQIAKIENRIAESERKGNREARIVEWRSEIADLGGRIDRPLFQRVDYKSEIDFLRDHALMLVKAEDLENTKDVFLDPNLIGLLENLNASMEKEYVGREESLSTREEEDRAWGFLDGIQGLVSALQRAARGEELSRGDVDRVVDELVLGEPYFLSYDETALILNVIPNFTLMDRDYIMTGTRAAQALLDELKPDFPDVDAGLSGAVAKEHDEQVSSQQSMGLTTAIAFIFILALMVISFRMWLAPLFAVLNLAVGLIWAFGAASLAVGQLNMFTMVMSVVLLGLGIDFSIHFFSGFTEWRARGDSIACSLEKTFLKNGKGIVTGAVTTACAFLTLVISTARGMKEMGLVTGLGLLAILMATLLFLPVLLVFWERRGEKTRVWKVGTEPRSRRDISFRFLGLAGEWLYRHHVLGIVSALALSGVLVWSALRIPWDYDFRSMEPKGLASIQLIDTVLEKFDLSMDYALVLAEDVDESRRLAEEYRAIASVAMTSDVSRYLPSPEEQQERIPHILQVRERLIAAPLAAAVPADEIPRFRQTLERLEMNIMEIQDMAFLGGKDKVDDKCKQMVGDPESPSPRSEIHALIEMIEDHPGRSAAGFSAFQAEFTPYFRGAVLRMCSTDPIRLGDLPDSVLDQYANRSRDLFLITVYPRGTIYDGQFFTRFVEDLERVSDKATGSPPIFVALIRILGQEGRNAVLLTLFIVFLLLMVDFRSPRQALVAMIPLGLGLFWMVGLMNLLGIKLSIMSVMGLPLIIGIGIDDGVHIMHRWRNEGPGRIRTVFASTGKAILLTSLTTMAAFGSMVFSTFPAWGIFGGALFLGVAACFITTVVVLPGILNGMERRSVPALAVRSRAKGPEPGPAAIDA